MAIEDVFVTLPVLTTGRLTLRRITEADADALFEIFADDQVTEHYAWDTFTDPEQGRELAVRTVEQYHRREAMRWGLVLPGTDRIIGTCGYTRWARDNRFAVVGYDLARKHWRRGLMSEAVAAVLRFGFDHLALNRVEATVLVGNIASAALLTVAGFRLAGRLAQRAWHRNTFQDVHMFGLIRSAWLTG